MKKKNFLDDIKLKEIYNLNDDFWNYLSFNAYPLTKGELRIPISLEPFEIDFLSFEKISYDIKNLLSSLKKIVNLYLGFKNGISLDEEDKFFSLDICDKERSLILNSSNEEFIGVVRVDIFFDKKVGFKVLEVNTDFPDGFFMHDKTLKGIKNKIDSENYLDFSNFNIFLNLLEEFEVDKEFDNIYIAYNKDRFFKDEFELSKLELQKFGFKNVFVGAVEDLLLGDDGFLYYEDVKINFLRRCFEISKIKENLDCVNILNEAILSSKTKLLNNFKMRLLGHKSFLTLLSDDYFHKYLSLDEIESINKILPKTYLLSSLEREYVFLNKDNFVLKPSDLAEGEGIFIGKYLSEEVWVDEINRIYLLKNEGLWILQEFVEVPEEEFTLIEGNRLDKGFKKYDFNPHLVLFKDKIEFGNILVRFSEDSVLNVMKGGGITYCLVRKD